MGPDVKEKRRPELIHTRLQDPQMPQVSPQEGRESRSNWAR